MEWEYKTIRAGGLIIAQGWACPTCKCVLPAKHCGLCSPKTKQPSPLLEACRNQLEEALDVVKFYASKGHNGRTARLPEGFRKEARDFCERWGIKYD